MRGCDSRILRATILAVFTQLAPSGVHPQTLLRESPAVAGIHFSLEVTIGETDGAGFISNPSDLEHRRNGEWVVTDDHFGGEVKFYSPEGDWCRTIGRDGEGPGEYREASWLHVRENDGLDVVDFSLSRITSLSPALEVQGTIRLPMVPFNIAFLDGESVIISGASDLPEVIGLPLHFIDADGRRVRSFGADPPIREWWNHDKVLRPIARSGTDAVWAGRLTEYTVEKWHQDGRRLAHFVRDVPWFQPHDDFGFRWDPEVPPGPGIFTLHEDEEGLLWVAIRVPDPEYREAYTRTGRPDRHGQPRKTVEDPSKYYDTVIEVIDPRAQTVIASSRMDAAVVDFTWDGLFFSVRYTVDSVPVIDVWQATIIPTAKEVR